jgi:hypothetical protein
MIFIYIIFHFCRDLYKSNSFDEADDADICTYYALNKTCLPSEILSLRDDEDEDDANERDEYGVGNRILYNFLIGEIEAGEGTMIFSEKITDYDDFEGGDGEKLKKKKSKLKNSRCYSSVIKHPIWLKKIKQRVSQGYYRSVFDFAEDIELMLNNCLTFNDPRRYGFCFLKSIY